MKYLSSITFATFLVFVCHVAKAQNQESWASTEKTTFTPKIHHPNIKAVKLFAQNPEIVTPVGIAVAPDGRVFVQENHTHKRNSNYKGPKTDRILVFEDKNHDGVAETRSVFYEGHTFSTDLLFGPDGHLYVSTRWFIGRFQNAAKLKKAEGEPEKIIVCETDGDYPHNGVGGLAIDPASPEWLAFGFGENLGADYTFVGSDGVKLSGGAEGGSTYRCRTDGSLMTRQSTGLWNAFGMAFDLKGNLFTTDNDPNATPPNRLLHVIPGADFGFEYRYGRSGRHPLVCWYGENPGTLGMIGALGEAACGLVPHGKGKLLSASWTDNRVDLHSLIPKGSSFAATREPFLSGPDDFRPVHFSYSPDGKYLYFTDWVKLSYPVHGHGRIWRVEFKKPIQLQPLPRDKKAKEPSANEAIALLGSKDPYVRSQAIHVLTKHPVELAKHQWQTDSNPTARAHYAVALKRSAPRKNAPIIHKLLADSDREVRFVGIKWIADEKLSQFEPNLKSVLDRSDLSRRDLLAVVAAISRISSESKKEFKPDDTLLEIAVDAEKPSSLRALALANVDVHHSRLTVSVLTSLSQSSDLNVRREAIHSLVIHADPKRTDVLAKIASDSKLDASLRADAIAGLSAGNSELLKKLASDSNPVISAEANRSLVAAKLSERTVAAKPPADLVNKWIEMLKRGSTNGPDKQVGRRLFFHPVFASCYKCHKMRGRGSSVGPDLTGIHNQTDVNEEWLLTHIVNPNAEMAPYYRPQILVTFDGRTLTGLVVGKEGKKQLYVAADGSTFSVDKEDIEERRELKNSIMPTGLLDALSVAEIRHLIAYLLSKEKLPSDAAANDAPAYVPLHRKQGPVTIIADFEGDEPIVKIRTTHKASVEVATDTPKNGGKFAMKTVVDKAASAEKFFGTGVGVQVTDLSAIGEIRFWLKTDIESNFNFQIHSGNRASVFTFSTGRKKLGTWMEIEAPLDKFKQPPWSKEGKADLKKIDKIQLTAFGGGPYDGKYILLDNVVHDGAAKSPATAKSGDVVLRGGPIIIKEKEAPLLKSPPKGFRSLFDGKTLNGWTAKARLPVPKYPGAPFKWQLKGKALEDAKKNVGSWTVKNGAIVGGQDPPGSGKGAYLVSKEKFSDFELIMDMKSDWKTDSGFLVRTLPGGSPGMQILVDHRPQGGIGGFYGNGIAGIHGMPFAIDANYDEKGNPIGIIAANPQGANVELKKKTRDILSYAANVEDFLKAWKWGQWNTIKVRCEGRVPKFTTWVNGVKIAVLDMNTIEWEHYDKEAVAKMLGRKGHISLEVHNNNFKTGLGKDRWWPGAVVRWKNIYIRELE